MTENTESQPTGEGAGTPTGPSDAGPSGYDAGYRAGYQAGQSTPQPQPSYSPPGYRRLTRSRTDAPISGVCGGLAQYLNLDPTLVRVLVAVAMVLAFPVAEIVYIVMWAVVPQE